MTQSLPEGKTPSLNFLNLCTGKGDFTHGRFPHSTSPIAVAQMSNGYFQIEDKTASAVSEDLARQSSAALVEIDGVRKLAGWLRRWPSIWFITLWF